MCTAFAIDSNTGADTASFNGTTRHFTHWKDGQWLGGSISVKAGIVTCAPRWGNRYSDDNVYMLGMCYIIPKDLTPSNIIKLPALVNDGKYTYKNENNRTIFDWGMAGYGINAHFTSKATSLLFGAPGLKDWTGGFVNIHIDTNPPRGTVTDIDLSKVYETSSLAGFAISSGFYTRNLTNEYYTVGIPRANLNGQVKMFASDQSYYSLQSPVIVINAIDQQGDVLPMNSYFGGSLLTADVNADGIDDLLVGAPLYSPDDRKESVDLGAVFLYLGPLSNSSRILPTLFLKGRLVGGRFGTSIASLKDIDRDGFNDTAVGAPFEDEERGAVYVFNGYVNGLRSAFSQRIAASDLPDGLGLRGFGISIANAVDINGDKIPDTVVGAHLSDHAVVLYGRPAIRISAELKIQNRTEDTVKYISKGSDDVYIRTCFRYNYPDCTRIVIDISYRLDVLKPDRERVVFNQTRIPVGKQNKTVFSGNYECSDRNWLYAMYQNDWMGVIKIVAEYEIISKSCSVTIDPTIGIVASQEQNIEFKKDCPDNICKTDLHVRASASFDNSSGFLIIRKQELSLNINITKTEDPSYGSVFYMIFPNVLNFIRVRQFTNTTVSCSLLIALSPTTTDTGISLEWIDFLHRTNVTIGGTDTVLGCNFGNPLIENDGIVARVDLTLPDYISNDSIHLAVIATTLSDELTPSDNKQDIIIPLHTVFKTQLTGATSLETVLLDRNKISDTVDHTFVLDNLGPSPIPNAVLRVFLPFAQYPTGLLLWVNITTVQCKPHCNVECEFHTQFRIPDIIIDINGHQSVYNSGTTSSESLTTTTNLNCTSRGCTELKCRAWQMRPGANLVITARLIIQQSLGDISKDGVRIPIVSYAATNATGTNDTAILQEEIVTRVVPMQGDKNGASWWVILLSVLGGVGCVAGIVGILFKFGFFQRKRKTGVSQAHERRYHSECSQSPNDNCDTGTGCSNYVDITQQPESSQPNANELSKQDGAGYVKLHIEEADRSFGYSQVMIQQYDTVEKTEHVIRQMEETGGGYQNTLDLPEQGGTGYTNGPIKETDTCSLNEIDQCHGEELTEV
ncbi:integrin alpha-4-like [Dreissena polymorpha]|nr:integrin alpha-4-like [Dreissena polymorpha]